MSATIDAANDPALESWVDSANESTTDFPIQNLPFGRFRRREQGGAGGGAPQVASDVVGRVAPRQRTRG